MAEITFDPKELESTKEELFKFDPAALAEAKKVLKTGAEPDIGLVKRAVNVITEPVPEIGFIEATGRAVNQALENFGAESPLSTQKAIRENLTKRGYDPNVARGLGAALDPAQSLGAPIASALEFFGAPIAGLGRQVNEWLQSGASAIGLPPKVAGTIGTAGNVATNVLAPGYALSPIQKFTKFGLARLPGAQTARAEQLGQEFSSTLGDKLVGASVREGMTKEAMDAIAEGTKIPVSNTIATLREIVASDPVVPRGHEGTLSAILANLEKRGGVLSPHELNKTMSDIGELTGALKKSPIPNLDVDKTFTPIFAALAKDASNVEGGTMKFIPNSAKSVLVAESQPDKIEIVKRSVGQLHGGPLNITQKINVPQPSTYSTAYSEVGYPVNVPITGTDAGQKVLAYRAAVRERKSLEDIQKVLNQLMDSKRGMDTTFAGFNGARMRNWINQRPKLMEGIPEADLADLDAILVKLAELPALPPPKGIMYGAGKAAETMATVGGGLMATGVDPRRAGAIGGMMTGLAAVSRNLLPSRIGRKALIAVLESGDINKTKINMLHSFAQAMKQSEQEQSQ